MFLVLFCSTIAPAPLQSEFIIDWVVEPTAGDKAIFAGDDSGGEEEDYSLKKETEEYL